MERIIIMLIISVITLFISCTNLVNDAIDDLKSSIHGPLIYYYKFNSAANFKAIDSSGNNLDGKIAGAISVIEGKDGNAFNFSNGDIEIPPYNFGINNQMSIEVWFKCVSLYSSYVSGIIINDDAYCLRVAGSDIIFSVETPTFYDITLIETTTEPILLGAWYHIAVTYSGQQAKLYLNGTLNTTTNILAEIGEEVFETSIGRLHHTNTHYDINLDELKIYNTVRTADEIAADYDATVK